MKSHEPLSVLLHCGDEEDIPWGLISYLESMSHVRVEVESGIPPTSMTST